MPTPLSLSVLDQSAAYSGRTHADSIRGTLALARHCEAEGYRRFWVSEHHNHDSIVGSAPEVLLGAIAATTTRIRIGSAGIMLPHYASLKVAEQFRVLEALAPGRVDMGLGRAPGSDGLTAYALNPDAAGAADRFPSQVRELMAWVSGAPLPEGHPFRAVRAFPAAPGAPAAWILGSSDYGAQVAGHFGLPYCFAYFFSDGRGTAEALHAYRQTFKPGPALSQPYASLCVWALAADTEAEAERQFASRAAWRVLRDRGSLVPLPTPDEAAALPFSAGEQARIAAMRARSFVGTGPQVVARLQALAAETGAQELAIVTWATEERVRQRSYSLIAEAAGLRDGLAAAA